MKKWFEANPDKKAAFDKLQEDAKKADEESAKTNYTSFRTAAATIYTVPIVFHILHLNGPENISDAQVQDAVNILNRDFRKLNTDTANIDPAFKSLAADVKIEFRLPTKDPGGNCTNGITRHYDPSTNWDPSDFGQYKYTWPNSKYLNVYVVTNIPNAAGYTYLPGTVGGAADVIVIRHDYVGSIGTANPYLSRALTHEVGHWFNLQHVWGSTNQPGVACGDDGVSDTPVTKGFTWCSSTNPSVCNPPIIENIQNYMEYAYCSRMFTIGQAARMTNCITAPTGGRNNTWSNSNLMATGVINPIGPCAPIADFMVNNEVVCVNGSVNFIDLSYNGTVTAWQWQFPGASSTVSTVQNPTATFIQPGLQTIQLKAINGFGADSVKKDIVTVLAGAGSGIVNVTQSFETITFPDNFWITRPPTVGAGWIQTSTVAATGAKCVMVDNYFDTPNAPVSIYTPMFDLTSLQDPGITFNVAYSQNGANSNDRLRVYYSDDCAGSWIPLYSKSGAALHTLGSGPISTAPFTNPAPSQWRHEKIAMGSSFSAVNNLLLKFEFTPDSINPGNNIFLDDINIENVVGIKELKNDKLSFQVLPNPASANVKIEFTLENKNTVSVELFDLSGKLIQKANYGNLEKGKQALSFDTGNLSSGLYILKLSNGVTHTCGKLAIDR